MDKAKNRKPYQPPRIVTFDVFERLALACSGAGRIGGTRLKGATSCSVVSTS